MGAGPSPPPPVAPRRSRREAPRRPSEKASQRTHREILVQEITQGLGELRRPAAGLLLSGLSAGLDLGFSVFLMGTMLTLVEGELSPAIVRILVANLYAVGFLFVVLGRSELFTEHTALAVFPVLSGRASTRALARLWVLVYTANVAGALLFSLLIALLGPALGIITPEALRSVAEPLVGHSLSVTLASAAVAGWLMGLLSWLVAAARDTISQIALVWLVTASIGLLQLHHCIAGTVEVGAALMAGAGVDLDAFLRFLLLSTVGNSVGGVVFVGLIKYSHVVRSGPEAEEQD